MSENSQNTYFDEHESQEMNPWELLAPLLKNRWEIALIVACALLVGVLYNLYATPIYHAQSTVIIRQFAATSPMKETETDINDRINMYDFNTKVKQVNSMTVLENLVKRLMEQGYYQNTVSTYSFDKMSKDEQQQFVRLLANGIYPYIKVEVPRDTNLVTISYESPNPVLARDVVNSLANTVVDVNKQEQFLMAQTSSVNLKEELEIAKKELLEAERKLAEYKIAHNIFEKSWDDKSFAEQRTSLNEQLTHYQTQKKEMESQIEQLNALLKQGDYTKYTPVLAENPLLIELRQKLVGSEIEYRELNVKYGPKHPEVIAAKERIQIIKEQFDQELNISRKKLEYMLDTINSKLALIQAKFTSTESDAVKGSEKDVDYIVLERDVDAARTKYQSLLGAVKEVSINFNTMSSNVIYVHEYATVPVSPIKPRKALNHLISIIFGLALGGAFAYVRETMDQTVRHPEDIKKTTGLSVLSTIPLYSPKGEVTKEPLHITYHPKSLFSESITALRTHLNIKLPQETPIAILVTSSVPQEGKSLISANLAISMAQDGKKTLLVDADLHHPTIHKSFSKEKQKGLFDIIVGAMNPRWADIDLNMLSFGDLQHMIRLKQWSGRVKISWNSLGSPLTLSYKEGRAVGSNFKEWKEKILKPAGYPSPSHPAFSMDDSAIADFSSEDSGRTAMEYIQQYPNLVRSSYFMDRVTNMYVQDSDFPNLQILTAGSNPINPSEILGSEQMRILIGILKERYERIILDSPPAWPLSDVGVLSPLVDGMLWVCRSGEIPKNMFARNVNQIRQIQPNILGVVLNGIDIHRERYYYYGYSSYYYYRRYYASDYYYYSYGKDRSEGRKKEGLALLKDKFKGKDKSADPPLLE